MQHAAELGSAIAQLSAALTFIQLPLTWEEKHLYVI